LASLENLYAHILEQIVACVTIGTDEPSDLAAQRGLDGRNKLSE
jgi:hypothetical protein